MTQTELLSEMKKVTDKVQNERIEKLHSMVTNLCDVANNKKYQPTNQEREMFNEIANIIIDMKKWF